MKPDISIVVPIYNEAGNVLPLYELICEGLDQSRYSFKVIFVDDGSTDHSRAQLKSLVHRDRRIKVILLRRNFGQSIAMQTGIQHADGRVIVTLDGDLQNDPRDILRLVELIDKGYDLVSGWRKNRKDHLFSRKIPSRIANWLLRQSLGVRVHDLGCTLRAYRRELIQQVPLYADLHRFIPAMCLMATDRVYEVEVRHHHRKSGISKYGLSRTWRVPLDALTLKMLLSCAQRPLYWFGSWALAMFLLAALAGVATVATTNVEESGYVWPGITLLFSYVAFHLLFCGIFTDIVVRAASTQRVTPLFDIEELDNCA